MPHCRGYTVSVCTSHQTRLCKVFAEFGVPVKVHTDNGSLFNGKEFQSFANNLGFDHWKITPKWPRANGEAEQFMCMDKKTIKAANMEQCPWKEELHEVLCNY